MGKFHFKRTTHAQNSTNKNQKKQKPYNFISLNDRVFYPQDCGEVEDKAISFDMPFKDSQSGVLSIKITSLSEIFTGDFKAKDSSNLQSDSAKDFAKQNAISQKDSNQNAQNTPTKRDFFKIGDKFAFSGSSIRGAIRNIAEIISFAKCKTDMPPTNDKKDKNKIIKRRNFEKGEKRLDFVERIFGVVNDDFALKSRISFSHFINTNNVAKLPEKRHIIMTPEKETFAKGKNGFKIYTPQGEIAKNNVNQKSDKQDNQKVITIIKPLPKDTEFSGFMRFFNLTKSELGLLLLSLTCLEKYKFGGMKFYGYGDAKIEIDYEKSSIDEAQECIDAFKNLLQKNSFDVYGRLKELKELSQKSTNATQNHSSANHSQKANNSSKPQNLSKNSYLNNHKKPNNKGNFSPKNSDFDDDDDWPGL